MNTVIKLYEVGQKIKNPKNGQIFEIVSRECITEDTDCPRTEYKIQTEYQGKKLTSIMYGNKLSEMISKGLEVM